MSEECQPSILMGTRHLEPVGVSDSAQRHQGCADRTHVSGEPGLLATAQLPRCVEPRHGSEQHRTLHVGISEPGYLTNRPRILAGRVWTQPS